MLAVFENRVLRTVIGPNRDNGTGGENCIMRRFVICGLYEH
jgi:hypothetical protein